VFFLIPIVHKTKQKNYRVPSPVLASRFHPISVGVKLRANIVIFIADLGGFFSCFLLTLAAIIFFSFRRSLVLVSAAGLLDSALFFFVRSALSA
jgi:hypothetical protein